MIKGRKLDHIPLAMACAGILLMAPKAEANRGVLSDPPPRKRPLPGEKWTPSKTPTQSKTSNSTSASAPGKPPVYPLPGSSTGGAPVPRDPPTWTPPTAPYIPPRVEPLPRTPAVTPSLPSVPGHGALPDKGFDSSRLIDAAMLTSCGWERAPDTRGPWDTRGGLKSNWRWAAGTRVSQIEFSMRKYRKDFYSNAVCELYMLRRIQQQGRSEDVRDRCLRIKNELWANNQELSQGHSAGDGEASFSTLSFLDEGASVTSTRDYQEENCGEGRHEVFDYACKFLSYKSELESDSLQKKAARQVMAYCESKGAQMSPNLTWDQYNSYSRGGWNPGGTCGYPGGPIILDQRQGALSTVVNGLLGGLKIGLPIASQWHIAAMGQKTSRVLGQGNINLGFPVAVSHGPQGAIGFGVQGGFGQGGFGQGGFGGPFNPYGFNPYGFAQGNGGFIVGGGGCGGGIGIGGAGGIAGIGQVGFCGGGQFPGFNGGGVCGMPPFAPWNQGCGAGGFGVGGGGFNGIPGFGSGATLPGMGALNGLPGPFGTAGGGNGWNPNGGFGMGGYGSPFGGMNGFMGNNQNMFNGQAQMWALIAAQMQRQAQQQGRLTTLYANQSQDAQRINDKMYESFNAMTMAQNGLYGNVGGNGLGGTSGAPGPVFNPNGGVGFAGGFAGGYTNPYGQGFGINGGGNFGGAPFGNNAVVPRYNVLNNRALPVGNGNFSNGGSTYFPPYSSQSGVINRQTPVTGRPVY